MAPSDSDAALKLSSLTIRLPDGRELLHDASLVVEPGEFVVLVGPSGSGKTTLLRLIAGIGDPHESGIACHGRVEVGKSNGHRDVGLVFQNHALFDELTARGNVQIATDHRADKKLRPVVTPEKILKDLNVKPEAKPARLSGGERQRVAVARTMATNPPLLLFDEPTTGLDPARSAAVVELIADTNSRHKKTIVVVTHDYEPFLEYEPRLVLLDAATRELREIEADGVKQDLARAGAVIGTKPRSSAEPGWKTALMPYVVEPGRALVTLLGMINAMAGSWNHPKWKLRYLWYYVRMVAAGTTAIYVAIAGAMLGYVFVNFSFAQIPYSEVTVPLLTEEFLAATGYSTFRVIVPLLIAVLVAGKCGASVAADVGTRRYANQLDAMRNCRIRPSHYLYGNISLALIIGVPLLTMVAYVANCYASLVAFLVAVPEGTVALFGRNYFATIWPEDHLLPVGTGWVTLKMATSGVVVAALSYCIGARPKSSPVDVSRDVGLTIFWASLCVLLLHSFYSRIEF